MLEEKHRGSRWVQVIDDAESACRYTLLGLC